MILIDTFFVQKVAEFQANRNKKKSSSKKLEPTTAAPLPAKNLKFDGFDDDELGGFHLLDLIITELKSHMTCYNSMPLIGWNYSIQTGKQTL